MSSSLNSDDRHCHERHCHKYHHRNDQNDGNSSISAHSARIQLRVCQLCRWLTLLLLLPRGWRANHGTLKHPRTGVGHLCAPNAQPLPLVGSCGVLWGERIVHQAGRCFAAKMIFRLCPMHSAGLGGHMKPTHGTSISQSRSIGRTKA